MEIFQQVVIIKPLCTTDANLMSGTFSVLYCDVDVIGNFS